LINCELTNEDKGVHHDEEQEDGRGCIKIIAWFLDFQGRIQLFEVFVCIKESKVRRFC